MKISRIIAAVISAVMAVMLTGCASVFDELTDVTGEADAAE